MIIKRLILALLTVLAIAQIVLSLGSSLTQPQIQNRLELYQTNLVLHITDFSIDDEQDNLQTAVNSLVGKEPLVAAQKQYQKARDQVVVSLGNVQAQLDKLSDQRDINRSNFKIINDAKINKKFGLRQEELTKAIAEINSFINELDVKLGILDAVQGNRDKAIFTWDKTIERINNSQDKFAQTATVLTTLWSESPEITSQTEPILNSNLDGWLRNQALEQLYRVENRQAELANLQAKQQQLAEKAIIKLALISSIPFVGGITGFILLLILLFQWLWKKEASILSINSNSAWTTPWDWEIIWQVLIVGFFFIGQLALPIILSILGFNPVNYSLRLKALYVLVTYILMAVGGITVLYLSLKSFLPLTANWFRFKLNNNWFVWGFGGYLVALPLVLLVSLINQQIWQGQGGSNPLLFLALQAQDRVALAIFFITASIAAPIFEEIMFRGFLLPSLTRYIPVWASIVISGFIFAIAHLSLSEVLPLATLGIILGFVYTRSRNLFAPMLLHSLWNSGTLLSLFILGSSLG